MGGQDANTDRDDAVTNGSILEFMDTIYKLEENCGIIFRSIGELSEKDKECQSKINFICEKMREICLLSYPKIDESIYSMYGSIGSMVVDRLKIINDKIYSYTDIYEDDETTMINKYIESYHRSDIRDILEKEVYLMVSIIYASVVNEIMPSIERHGVFNKLNSKYGVSDMHSHFKEQCSNERDVSYMWAFIYFISMIFLASFLCYLWTITISPPDDLKKVMSYSDILSVNFFILKSIITVLFITLSVWCAKMYSRACHRMTLNAHRENILKTLKNLLYVSANNQKLSEDIIREGMRSVFAPIDTGYLKKGGEMSLEETLKIIDAMKGLTKPNV